MKTVPLIAVALALVTTAIHSAPSHADFHFWHIREIFTNQSGKVQFIELFTTASGQHVLNDHSISSTSMVFPFLVNSPTPTNSRHMLLATSGFGAIPGGATPNYTIPSNFFSVTGDTINFGPGANIRTFASIPTDGVMSLNYTATGVLSITANSPRNHANQGMSVNLPPPDGDYNNDGVVDAADFVVWRRDFGAAAAPAGSGADGDEDGTIDDDDYNYWRARFGNVVPGSGSGAAVPEPQTIGLAMLSLLAFFARASTNSRSIRRLL